jgi:hypothetical protein
VLNGVEAENTTVHLSIGTFYGGFDCDFSLNISIIILGQGTLKWISTNEAQEKRASSTSVQIAS